MTGSCRIVYYVSHATHYGRTELRFRAEATGPNGAYVAGQSPVFKGDAAYGPNALNPEHREALETLVAALVRDGWEPVELAESAWYARAFRLGVART